MIGIRAGVGISRPRGLWRAIQALFAASEKGVWYDPSDLATMYQESTGVTPVTAVGQPVGLMLDKSKGLVLGSEVAPAMSDIDITSSYGWTGVGSTYASTMSVVEGALRVTKTQAIGQGHIGQNGVMGALPVVVGKSYKITLRTGTHTGAGGWDARFGLNNEGAQYCRLNGLSDNSSYTAFFTATTTTCYISLMSTGGAIGDYNDWVEVSVKELPGYHASQSTSTARPILARHPISGRRNLLTYTEDFSNAAWTAAAVTVTSGVSDPFGGTSAFRLVNTNNLHALSTVVTSSAVAGVPVTFSFYAKSNGGTKNYIGIWDRDGVGAATVSRDFTSEINTNTFTKISVTITPGAGASRIYGYLTRDQTSGTVDVIVADPQLELGSTPTAYQKVVSTYDVTEAGVADAYHLKFDGVDDFLATPSIDFTATDKMSVFAGVRKLSDAAADGCVFSLSADAALNNGATEILYPYYIAGGFTCAGLVNRGTIKNDTSGTNHAAPATAVITSLTDISGTSFKGRIRRNGTTEASTTLDLGTGNFGNYPVYIGAVGGAYKFLNGHLYSLIVRGALPDAAQIAAAESYVNSKTGAY